MDGRDSPASLIEAAKKKGLSTVSITDHNTIDGQKEALEAAEKGGLRYISGVEIWGNFCFDGALCGVHILGYFFPPDARALRAYQGWPEIVRLEGEAMLEGLAHRNIHISQHEIENDLPGQFCALTLRNYLVQRGHAEDRRQASKMRQETVAWATANNPRYESLYARDNAAEIIQTLHEAGASVYYAHPHKQGAPDHTLWPRIETMRTLGLDGIEVYNKTDPEVSLALLDYCRKHQMPASGGTDAHAAAGVGALAIPDMLVESMERHAAGLLPWS